MLTIKILGLSAVFSVCTLWGFFKADTLRKRAEKLNGYLKGIRSLAEKIRICEEEIQPLVKRCFGGKLVSVVNNSFEVNRDFLKTEDINLLNEFFENLGMGDANSEYRRAEAYSSLFENQYTSAHKDSLSLSRLYKTLGALFGIFICIFLL